MPVNGNSRSSLLSKVLPPPPVSFGKLIGKLRKKNSSFVMLFDLEKFAATRVSSLIRSSSGEYSSLVNHSRFHFIGD